MTVVTEQVSTSMLTEKGIDIRGSALGNSKVDQKVDPSFVNIENSFPIEGATCSILWGTEGMLRVSRTRAASASRTYNDQREK